MSNDRFRTPSILLRLAAVSCLSLALVSGDGGLRHACAETAAEPLPLVVGTLPTEDSLPLWAAEANGWFAPAGLRVEIVTFQSAQERDAALVAGSIQAFMGDLIATASLEAAGTPVSVATVMLGATPAEGRFGVVAAPGSDLHSLADLAGVPVGTSSGTIQEYVLDGLMAAAGVPASGVVVEEVKKVPVRFQLLVSGKVRAAALPEPLLSLAESMGARLLADDAQGRNLSQTVLVVSDAYLARPGGREAVRRLLSVWDRGAAAVDADPDAWRNTLVEKARLPDALRATYRVNHYPAHRLPERAEVDAVLAWMRGKGLLRTDLTYEDLVVRLPE